MSGDFTGLKIIWPPDSTRPPTHKHDIIFVHGLHDGSMTDWQDENGVCWPSKHLALDLGDARIFSFGYDHSRLNVQSDGFYEGGLLFNHGMGLYNAVNTARRADKAHVPFTLVGHGTGGIVIKSALCISHLLHEQLFNVLLRKTKHVVFLETPHADFTWDCWKRISHGSPSADSRGRWKVWSAALDSSSRAFSKIARCFNITSVIANCSRLSVNTEPDTSKLVGSAHEHQVVFDDVDHRTISRLSRGSSNYKRLLTQIQANTTRIIKYPGEVQDIPTWLGRGPDQLNRDSYQDGLDKHHSGTCQWLFEDATFRDWANLEKTSPVLWLTGPEGCGKSVLCSLAAERIRITAEQPAVLYLMLAFDRPRSEYQLTAQLALQLLDYVEKSQEGVDSEALSVISDDKNDTKKLTQARELVKVLISQCPVVYVFLDGLDEVGLEEEVEQTDQDIEPDRPRKPLHSTLTFLTSLGSNKIGAPLRLWCSSRKTDITDQWMKDMDASELQVDEDIVESDIANYLEHKVDGMAGNECLEKPKPATMESLTKAIRSSFLIASVVAHMLQTSKVSAENWIQQFLLKSPMTVNELYQERLDQLQQFSCAGENSSDEKSGLALQIISLVAFAKRPLRLKEVEEALAIAETPWQDFASQGFHCPDLLLHEVDKLDNDEIHRWCAPFVSLRAYQKTTGDGILRLSHVSAYNFLRGLSKRIVSQADKINIGADLIADTCVKYLSQKRYANAELHSIHDHRFFTYAAKYWHQHTDESESNILETASSFMQSPQFLVVTKLQSLFLDRHFSRDIENDDESRYATANIPETLSKQDDSRVMGRDYLHFFSEWAPFLRLGVTNSASRGDIGKCFWGALGKQNFLTKHVSPIEKQNSFLLEMDVSHQDSHPQDTLTESCFYQTISDDGKRVAVWKARIHRGYVYNSPTPDYVTLKRQSWYIDGHRPPFSYGPQETLTIDTKQVQWDSYDSTFDQKIPLIPILDAASRVAVLDEYGYGAEARVGGHLFRRERRGLWIAPNNTSNDESYWEDITSRGPWTVRSRRKLLKIDEGAKTKTPSPKMFQDQTESPAESSENDGSESENMSAVDDTITGRTRQQLHSNSDSDFQSDSHYEESVSDQSFGPLDPLSSAEEFYADSPSADDSANESSDDEFSMSTGTVNNSECDDDQSDTSSDSPSEASSQGSFNSRAQPSSLATSKAQKLSSSKGSSQSKGHSSANKKGRAAPKPVARPLHQFSWGRLCHPCGAPLVPSEYRELAQRQHTFYQCSPCGNCSMESYDICSNCFDKGAWCSNDSHLLSRATFSGREKLIRWEDGISQQAAMPIVTIVADHRGRDMSPSTRSFRYARRCTSMLHSSRPIIHPTLPLLIYPLDGLEFLFGNLKNNTCFTYEIPFDARETAETSGSTCIPVSVNLRFSTCGKYVHLVRFTTRNETATLGPIKLHAMVLTIALSPKDACSGKPRTLTYRHGMDLGTWPRLISQLPFAVTWAHSDVYVSMSDVFLHVLRFPLRTEDKKISNYGDAAGDVSMLSQEVPLPRSALSRPVYFFSNAEHQSAKIILGSASGPRAQPPIVVYLNINNTGDWIKAKPGRVGSVPKSLQTRNDPMIEEPYVDDDYDLMVGEYKVDQALTIEPIITGGLQSWLESSFRKAGIYCPSCFNLGIKLAYLRLPTYLPVYEINANLREDSKFKINWEVKVQSLMEALKAGCQFCCYVACRMLNFSHIAHTTQSIGIKGTRCCAQGDTTEDPKSVQDILDTLEKLEWQVKPEERRLVFECHPVDQDIETRAFSKLVIRMPSAKIGTSKASNFMPIVVMIKDGSESGDNMSLTTFIHSNFSSHGTPECVLEMHSLPHDAAHQFTDTRPLTTSRGGEDNLAVAKGWLEDCKSNHAFCQRHENTQVPLPSRLIEIIDSENVRLLETAGRVGQYVALSYCWGPDPEENSKTTVSNFTSRIQPGGFSRDHFPGAIKDAIIVSELLGIKYVWVDALCIIQDDIEDRKAELGKMSQYYRNSYLTIAVSTPRCTIGFVGTMGRCENHPDFPLPRDLVPLDIYSLDRDTNKGNFGTLYVREESPYYLSEEPINKRAWTLQECVLAPRVLLFGSRVIWLCQHMTCSDGGVEDWSFDESDLQGTRRRFHIELENFHRKSEGDIPRAEVTKYTDNSQDIYDLWHLVVQTFSRRDISQPGDKFPAISAIASEFRRLSGDDYLAGSWRSNLPRDLLWTTPDPATCRPETWRAPTWSWASVNDVILYNQLPPKDATLLAEVIRAETIPLAAEVPFGEIGQARLEIAAPSFMAKAGLGDSREKLSGFWLKGFGMKRGTSEREMLLEILKMSQRSNMGVKGDEKENFQLPEEFKVAIIYGKRDELVGSRGVKVDAKEESQRWTTWGLLLKPVAGASQEPLYERVIAFSQIPIAFADDEGFFSQREKIRII